MHRAASVYSAPFFFSEKRSGYFFSLKFMGLSGVISLNSFKVDQTNFKVLELTPGLDGFGPSVAELVVMNLCIYQVKPARRINC